MATLHERASIAADWHVLRACVRAYDEFHASGEYRELRSVTDVFLVHYLPQPETACDDVVVEIPEKW